MCGTRYSKALGKWSVVSRRQNESWKERQEAAKECVEAEEEEEEWNEKEVRVSRVGRVEG